MLTNKELNLSGWMCVISAIVTIPLFIFSIYLAMIEENTTMQTLLEFGLSMSYTALFVYISLQLRKLLNQHASFHDIDSYITFLIWINVILVLFSFISILFPATEVTIGIIMFVSFIPMGIALVVMGIKLLKCEAEFSSKLKYFSYFTIASGVLLASVVFFLFSFLTSIVSDIILAAIFFSEIDRDKIEKEGYGVSS